MINNRNFLEALNNIQINNMTQLTRRLAGLEKDEPKINLSNRKPYRSKRMKAQARDRAVNFNGTFICPGVPVSYHPAIKD